MPSYVAFEIFFVYFKLYEILQRELDPYPFVFSALVDIGFSLYRRIAVVSDDTPQVSLAAHFAGGLAGITIGYVVFSNFNKNLMSDPKWWVCLIAYLVACAFAVFWNLFLSPVGTV